MPFQKCARIIRVRADTGNDPEKDYFNILTTEGRWYNAMDEYELAS